jgi:hypothetical protein
MFIRKLQGTYECPSTVETLKTIKQKHDESLCDFIKHFCNLGISPRTSRTSRSSTPSMMASAISRLEEIAMKKPKTVVDLLAVADICIEASEARARLLESRDKGSSRKKEDQEVNTTDRGDQKDRGDRRYRRKQFSYQKEKIPFQRLDDVEKWCEIHHHQV